MHCLSRAALLLPCLLANVALAGSITINPTKDNTLIEETSPSSQRNALGDIFVGQANQDGAGAATTISIRRGLVAFDIKDSVPPGATITGVSLSIMDVMGLNGTRPLSCTRHYRTGGRGPRCSTAAWHHGHQQRRDLAVYVL